MNDELGRLIFRAGHSWLPMRSLIVLCSLLIIHYSLSFAATPYPFLTIPVGAREAAMGETGIADGSSGEALWWNPALVAARQGGVSFEVVNWIADGRGSFGGASLPARWGGFGIYYFNLGIPGFEVRDHPGPAVGTFTVHNTLLGAGGAIKIGEQWSAGASWKWYQDFIYGETATTSGILDFGVRWHEGDLSLAGVFSNTELWDYVAQDLPRIYKLGGAWSHETDRFGYALAADALFSDNDPTRLHIGGEASWARTIFVRAGYMMGHDSRSLAFGLGVAKDRYRADVAITPFSHDLGTVWRAGLGIGL